MSMPQDMQKPPINEDDIVEYLKENSEFFERHTDLLKELSLPHETGKAISLVEKQISVLRDENRKISKQLQDLIQVARQNDQVNQRTHKLAIDLIQARTMAEVLDKARESFLKDFATDVVGFRLLLRNPNKEFNDRPEFVSGTHPAIVTFEKIIREHKPVCGKLQSEQLKCIFNEPVEEIRSVALLPITSVYCTGLFCFGSHDENRFNTEKGTVFLEYIAKIVSSIIEVHIRHNSNAPNSKNPNSNATKK